MQRVGELSDETVNALVAVQITVKEATAQVHSIAAAVEEQSASSSEVASLVGEVSSIASGNTELVVRADDELRSLTRKAADLLELVTELRKVNA